MGPRLREDDGRGGADFSFICVLMSPPKKNRPPHALNREGADAPAA